MESPIKPFYEAFKNCDATAMTSLYHDEIEFKDPAFGLLKGQRAKAMWHMLCDSQRGKDFKVTYSNVKYNETTGSVHWEAFYTFSQTGRRVHNKIEATFEFKDNLIIKHTDEFNLHKWAKQAMGITGIFFGGMRFFKSRLQHKANLKLDNYIKSKKLSNLD